MAEREVEPGSEVGEVVSSGSVSASGLDFCWEWRARRAASWRRAREGGTLRGGGAGGGSVGWEGVAERDGAVGRNCLFGFNVSVLCVVGGRGYGRASNEMIRDIDDGKEVSMSTGQAQGHKLYSIAFCFYNGSKTKHSSDHVLSKMLAVYRRPCSFYAPNCKM